MRLGQKGADSADRCDLDRLHQHRLRAGRRRRAARTRHRDLRTGVVRQDDARAAGDCRGAETGRHGRVRGRRARARRRVRAEARRRSRQPAGVAARQRRAGARDRRSPHPVERRGRRGRRLGGGARAEGRNRRRDGRRADGPAGPADVAGAAQAHRRRLEVEDLAHLHQPAAREDRRDVRQPRNHDRRPRAQVLRVGPRRHPPHCQHQGRRRRRRRAHAREDRQEQGRSPVPRGRVRRHVRRRHLAHGRSPRPGRREADHREERRVVRVRRRAPRPGARERQAVPQGQPGHRADDRRSRPARAGADRATSKPPPSKRRAGCARRARHRAPAVVSAGAPPPRWPTPATPCSPQGDPIATAALPPSGHPHSVRPHATTTRRTRRLRASQTSRPARRSTSSSTPRGAGTSG